MSSKRLLDVAVVASASLLLLPVATVVALMVLLFLGRPVLFRQSRPGYLGRPFTIFKFRTMRDAADAQGVPLPDGERLNWLGTFLRETSLDELPELWNVLRGDMSLVGPRPLLMRYQPFYSEEERIRFTVRPGITGWAQVNGRNEASWDDRLANDVWYVRNRSLLLDVKILLRTVVRVVKREQVVADARSIMLNLDEERAGLRAGGTQ